MAMIDIFNIQPTQLCKDLRGRFVLLYGQAKSGKTSMSAMWPKPLLVAFEKGYNALVGVRPADVTSWADFKSICRQLKKPEAKEIYETIVIDTIAIAYALCEKYILNREGVQAIGDIGYGKGWGMLKDEFESTFRELTQLGYSIVFIAHSKTKKTEYTDEEGNELDALAPDLPNAAYQIVNRMVDVIGYIGVEYDIKSGQSYRYLYTRGTPTIFAGSRYKYLAPKIELGYQQLVDAIAEAMEKEAEITGTGFVSESELNYSVGIPKRTFDETMTEAKDLWNKIIKAKGDEGREAIKNVISQVFGHDMQLSRATPEQQDMVELVVEDLRKIL